MSVKVPPRSIQNCQRPAGGVVLIGRIIGRRRPGQPRGGPARAALMLHLPPSSPRRKPMTIDPLRRVAVLGALSLGLAGLAGAQAVKWDLPAAYPASNFHTENLMQFAADVDKATGGKLKITVHANASL